MEDFNRTVVDDIVVETVNLTRATYKEAGILKNILKEDIERQCSKIIIDLSTCEFMDSTFIGVLVITLKEIAKIGGELRIVEPPSMAHTVLERSKTLELFNVLDTVEHAVKSLQYWDINKTNLAGKYVS